MVRIGRGVVASVGIDATLPLTRDAAAHQSRRRGLGGTTVERHVRWRDRDRVAAFYQHVRNDPGDGRLDGCRGGERM